MGAEDATAARGRVAGRADVEPAGATGRRDRNAAGAPARHDPAGVLRRHAAAFAPTATAAVFLTPPRERKNVLVAFRNRGEAFVLKVYCDSLRYRVHTFANPVLEHIAGAYVVRGRDVSRAENEARCIESCRRAGVPVPEIALRPGPAATVFRRVAGTPAHRLLRNGALPVAAEDFVHDVAADIARRQEQAVATGDRHLFHPHPRLSHVLVAPDASRTYIDMEGIVNRRLPPPRLAALETDCFVSYLAASQWTCHEPVLRAAIEGLGPAAVERWRGLRRGPLWFLSGTARHRRERFAEAGLVVR